MTAAAITSSGLSKRFGRQLVVDQVDLAVPTGSVYGFLGPNGSGKTTTIRMLLGLISATAGSSEVLGHPMPTEIAQALPKVGALVEGPAFHPYLSGRANLHRLDAADAHADPRTAASRIDAALDRVGLGAAAEKRYRAYSLGMKQRLAIGAALLMPRELLVLDEPTNGLDPQGTREVRNLVASLATEGATVLISSHLLSEVEQVCTHVGVMNRGRLVAQDSLAGLRARATTRVELQTPDLPAATEVLAGFGITATPAPDQKLRFEPGDIPTDRLVAALVAADVRVQAFNVLATRLEDIFVELTGEGFDVSG